jgi:hypothetical protein
MKRPVLKKWHVRDRAVKCDDRRSKELKNSRKPGDRGACESETTSQGSE